MALQVDPILGVNLQTVTLTHMTKVGTALTASNSIAVSVLVESLKFKIKTDKMRIESVNSTGINNVEIARAADLSLQIFRVSGATDPDALLAFVQTVTVGDMIQIVYTESSGASNYSRTVIGSFADLETGFEGRGKQIATLSIDSVSVTGGANYFSASV
jgi:hypothetical protein